MSNSIETNPQKVRSCLFTFEDHRKELIDPEKFRTAGIGRICNPICAVQGRGAIIGPGGREFNHVTSDTNLQLRIKFVKLTIFSFIKGVLFEIPYRIYDLAKGGSILRGIEESRKRFLALKVEGKNPNYTLVATRSILYSLAKDIAQLVTYPLYLLARQAVFLWGVLFPLDGIYMTSLLQETFTLDSKIEKNWYFFRKENHRAKCGCLNRKLGLTYYAAPCMTSKVYFKKKNHYRQFDDYFPGTCRSYHLRLENLLTSSPFFNTDEKKKIHSFLNSLKKVIKKASPETGEYSEKDWDNGRYFFFNQEALHTSYHATYLSEKKKYEESLAKVEATRAREEEAKKQLKEAKEKNPDEIGPLETLVKNAEANYESALLANGEARGETLEYAEKAYLAKAVHLLQQGLGELAKKIEEKHSPFTLVPIDKKSLHDTIIEEINEFVTTLNSQIIEQEKNYGQWLPGRKQIPYLDQIEINKISP